MRYSLRALVGKPLFLLALVACADSMSTPWQKRMPYPAAAQEQERECFTSEEDEWQPEPYPAEQRARHLARLGVDRLHQAGHEGQGIKVAILDFGFRGYRDHLGKSLPREVTVRSFRADGDFEAKDSQHGILCAEVLHAFAPKAEILLANWDPGSPEQFLDAVRWARKEGARVVSCSIIMPSWSDGNGGGFVNDGLARLLGNGEAAGDMLCFVSAGNTARRHWCGTFRPDRDGYHQWQDDATVNLLSPWSSDRVSAELYWSTNSEYEVIVHNDRTGAEVGRSTCRRHRANGAAVARFDAEHGTNYRVKVRLVKGEPGHFHLVALGGNLSRTTSRGSIACPADCPQALAIGAVSGRDRRASYSSCGPNSRVPKPDFVARVPFPSMWRDEPFTGTSAAAPQAAGIAALCWSKEPDRSAAEIRSMLQNAAQDLAEPGHDHETGYGLIQVPNE